jgi:hypothetical protein
MSTAASTGRASSPIHNMLVLGTRQWVGTIVVGLTAKPLKRMNMSLPTRLDPTTSACALQRSSWLQRHSWQTWLPMYDG